jgi:hypothetical protein
MTMLAATIATSTATRTATRLRAGLVDSVMILLDVSAFPVDLCGGHPRAMLAGVLDGWVLGRHAQGAERARSQRTTTTLRHDPHPTRAIKLVNGHGHRI